MGDIVTWQGDATVAQYMWGEVAEHGQAGSPGSGGASPYLPGFPAVPNLLTSTHKQKRNGVSACRRVGVPHHRAKVNKLTLAGAIPSGGKREGDGRTWSRLRRASR
jgi:hypothetical protein